MLENRKVKPIIKDEFVVEGRTRLDRENVIYQRRMLKFLMLVL